MKTSFSFIQQVIDHIPDCYAVNGLKTAEGPVLLFGAEGEGLLVCYSGENFAKRKEIWRGGGGTMSIVPIPGYDGWAFASRGFYSMVDSKGSRIEILRYQNGEYTHKPVAGLDYLHRFDTLLSPDGTRYILAASLHEGKQDVDDWSTPGHLYAGVLPEDLSEDFEVALKKLPGDFYMNHGFFKGSWENRDAAFISSREGVFAVLPPEKREDSWVVRQLLTLPVSDISLMDIDGDGDQELACLMPFHGNRFCIFKQKEGTWKTVYEHPAENDFYHAITCGRINGEKVFAVGARAGVSEIFLVRYDPDGQCYFSEQIEAGPGPSNLVLLSLSDSDLLLSAARKISEAAVYIFPKAVSSERITEDHLSDRFPGHQ